MCLFLSALYSFLIVFFIILFFIYCLIAGYPLFDPSAAGTAEPGD